MRDKVITEKETNKKSLIGIFENIYYSIKPPCTRSSLVIYLEFTEAKGSYNFRLELVDLEKNLVIGKGEIPQPINVANRLGTPELVFSLRFLTFKHEGKYEF